jgi:hypothetical protein
MSTNNVTNSPTGTPIGEYVDTEAGHDITTVPLFQTNNIVLMQAKNIIENGSIREEKYYNAADFAKTNASYKRYAASNSFTDLPRDLNVLSENAYPKDTDGNPIINESNINTITEKINNPEDKNTIVGIEVCLYPNNNGIAKIIGVYYCNLMNIYDISSYQATVDKDINYKEYSFINPLLVDDESISKDTIGDTGREALGEDVPILENRRFMFRGPIGYALSGVEYNMSIIGFRNGQISVNLPDGTQITDNKYLPYNGPVYNIIFRFTSVYDITADYIYSGIINGVYYNQVKVKPNIPQVNLVSYIPDNKNEFIQNMTFISLPFGDPKDPTFLQKLQQYALIGAFTIPGVHLLKNSLPQLINGIRNADPLAFSQGIATYFSYTLTGGIIPIDLKAIKDLFTAGDVKGFFSSFLTGNIFYSIFDSLEELMTMLDAVYFFTNTFGFKGIGKLQTISIDDTIPNNFYKWIEDIDYIKSCDFDVDNWYSESSVEYIYSRYIKDRYVSTISPTLYLPSGSCINQVLQPYCKIDANDPDSFDRFREQRCMNFCSLDNTDCDNSLKLFCKWPPEPKNTSSDNVGVDEDEYYITKNIRYTSKHFNIPEVNSMNITIVMPNVKTFMFDDICSCLLQEKLPYIDQLKNFYNTILNIYKQKLDTEIDDNNKIKINKEIEIINQIINELPLSDIIASYKLALKQKVKPEFIDKIINNTNDIKIGCSFTACAKSKYKLYNQKQKRPGEETKPLCNTTEDCIGSGWALPLTSDNDSKLSCQSVTSIVEDKCIIPLEPKISFVPSVDNYLSCRNIINTEFEYTDKIEPSECVLSEVPRRLGCDGNYVNLTYDVLKPEFPPGTSECPPKGKKTFERIFDSRCDTTITTETETGKKYKSTNIIFITMITLVLLIFFIFFFLYIKRK